MAARRPESVAAASTTVRTLLAGASQSAIVLAAFPTAVYLHVPGGSDNVNRPRVVAVLTADAVRLPVGVVLPVPSARRPWCAVPAGSGARVGDGRVELTRLSLRAARWWDPDVRRALPREGVPRPEATATVRRHLPPLPAAPVPAVQRLRAVVTGQDVEVAVAGLVGLGPGLTPAGDDVLAGALVGLHAFGGGARLPGLAEAVTRHAHRTTVLSGALLESAADGGSIPELTSLLRAMAGHGEPTTALSAVLRVGDTSGAALAAGALLACGALAEHVEDAA